MPFRIDVLDAALASERQAALAAVLIRDGGVEPELADLVSAMTPGTVAEVATVVERKCLTSSLKRAGFSMRVASVESSTPIEARAAITERVGPPPPAERPAQKGDAALGYVAIVGLVAVLALFAGLCNGPSNDADAIEGVAVLEAQADSVDSVAEDSDAMMTEPIAEPMMEDTTAMMMSDPLMPEPMMGDESLAEDEDVGVEWRVQSSDGYVNLRAWPDLTSQIIERVPDGAMLIVYRCNALDAGGRLWCRVDIGGRSGWVAESYIENNPRG